MKTSFLLTSFLGLALLNGCATHTFNVTSDPLQAEVFYQVPGTDERKPLGVTPLTLPMTEVKRLIGPKVPAGDFMPITVEKKGFEAQTVAVPASRFGTMMTSLDVKLKSWTPESDKKERDKQQSTAKLIIDRLFLAQRFALTSQFERAQSELDRILEDFPTFARAMSMRASIYYAQKNLPDALRWYELALKSDPLMDDAVKMAAKIRTATGGRLPSSTPAVASPGADADPSKDAKP